MIVSSMQGVNPDVRPRETTLNGKMLTDCSAEEHETLLNIAEIVGTRNLKHNNRINKLRGKYRYVYLTHPIKDKWGRTRITLILWEHGTVTQDDIENTVEVAGIDKNVYINIRENSKRFFIF